jgi:hypothetical protein
MEGAETRTRWLEISCIVTSLSLLNVSDPQDQFNTLE